MVPISGYPAYLDAYVEQRVAEGASEAEARHEAGGIAADFLANGNDLADFIPDFSDPEELSETQRSQLYQGFVNARDIVNSGDDLDNRNKIADFAMDYSQALRRSGCLRK
jgi:hypothetical protein